jgi:RHS repeat-associated protein
VIAVALALLLAVGNLTALTTPGSGTTSRTYDPADRITSPGYAHDANGALTADPDRTYAYDGFGRLASATLGTTTTSYSLDGAGRRLAETTGPTTTSFDLDLSGPLPTILSDGTRRYLPADPAAGYETGGTWYSALTDQLGSPHSTVSQGGVQSAISRWDPFGSARPGSTATSGIGYADEWRDPAGLIDLRARAYDPAFRRFVSRDGFGGLLPQPQTANRYSYALNGPYRYADPSGRFVNAIYANAPLLLSLAIQSTPGLGDAYGALTGLTGYDPIAGLGLSSEERALALAGSAVLGGGFHLLGRLADGTADATRLGRAGDELAGGVRAGVRETERVRLVSLMTLVECRLDQAFPDRVGDRVGPVSKLEPRRDVVDDVLDRPLGIEELPPDLGSVVALREQAQHGGLSLGQSRECQAARRQHLALELADLSQQPPEQVRRERALARRRGPDGGGHVAGRRLRPPDHARCTGLDRGQEVAVVDTRDQHHDARHASTPKRPQFSGDVLAHRVGHDQRDGVVRGVVERHDREPVDPPQLADDSRPRQRVGGADHDLDLLLEGDRLRNHRTSSGPCSNRTTVPPDGPSGDPVTARIGR